jgi:hypothetical protein
MDDVTPMADVFDGWFWTTNIGNGIDGASGTELS